MGDAYKDGRETWLCTTSLSTCFSINIFDFVQPWGGGRGFNPNHSILNKDLGSHSEGLYKAVP